MGQLLPLCGDWYHASEHCVVFFCVVVLFCCVILWSVLAIVLYSLQSRSCQWALALKACIYIH